jgi:uncharacterized membrane protein YfcA
LNLHDAALSVAVFVIAVMYSAVGHGGASGYLMVLSLAGVPLASMASTALLLNVVVAGIGACTYQRAGHFNWRKALPFVLSSVPAAMLGGLTPISLQLFSIVLALVLGWSAYRLAFGTDRILDENAHYEPVPRLVALLIGAGLGYLSGLIGIGGGIFLSPIIIMKRWASPQQTSAIASVFIVVNSLAGMVGRAIAGSLDLHSSFWLIAAGVLGGIVGSHVGANVLRRATICRLLSVVIAVAIGKLALTAIH